MTEFAGAFELVMAPQVLGAMLLAAIFGLFVGATPGLSATMATALLVPITFFMPPIVAIAAIVTCSAMAIFAGDIPGALLNIPGTPASAAYTNETFAMNRKGALDQALGANVTASAIGGVFGTVVLAIAAPQLANFALSFSSYEYFWLALLGLSCATLVSTGNPLKGIVSLCLGLLLSMIGLDVVTGTPRFTFGSIDLMGGVSLIAVLIGAFAVAELLRKATDLGTALPAATAVRGSILKGQARILATHRLGLLRGSTIGTLIGALPGAGADIAAWIAYAVSKRFSKTPEKFGTGHVEGVVEASAANNASLAGAYVPALVFGIPGDAITAIVVGVLMIKGITPGPTVFTKTPELVGAIYLVFLIANLMIVPLGIVAIRMSRHVLQVSPSVLYPVILLFCIVGAFATNNAIFDLWVILAIGVLVWLMNANDYPAAPMVLGLVLGRIVEENFVNSMIKSDGSLLPFVERPIAGVLAVLTVIAWLAPLAIRARVSMRAASRT